MQSSSNLLVLLALAVFTPAGAIEMKAIRKCVAIIGNLEMRAVDRGMQDFVRTHRIICSMR